jgi:hypothetical protein
MPIFHDIEDGSPPRMVGEEGPPNADDKFSGQMHEKERARMDERQRTPPDMAVQANDSRPLSRGELIERLKRGESPTWTMRHGFGRRTPDGTSPQQSPRESPPATLLPSVELKETTQNQQELPQDNNMAGMEIERPRSALHSGDFRDDKHTSSGRDSTPPLATSPVAPWHSQFSAFMGPRSYDSRPVSRSRASSQSSFSNFVLMPPTSPLVQASYNSDLDFTPKPIPQRRSKSPQKENRRHTFSPHSFQTFRSSPFSQNSTFTQPLTSLRREGTYPYQAHQPRKLFSTHFGSHYNSTPQTPLLRPRGGSNASELSPLHHAPMVGSYEESILRGRMSTTPSRPLNFVAQIGVLGKGKCKASLRCPPHVTVPFPAVFYSYASGNGRISDNQPSPYVGLIDLENTLPQSDDQEAEGRRRRRYASPMSEHDEAADSYNSQSFGNTDPHLLALKRKKERLKRRSQSPKTPPGGSYRIPQQGQLQIIIKNPNKTAVKLFLVPYDLSDMEPGQKTFIRQRSYSAGPIIDMPVSARTNLGTDRPEAALSSSEDPRDRPVLRYLIHLHICCPSKGRYFLYKSVRIVFANRVPDGKEKLRNEVQLPDPRYSVYKPTRDFHPSSNAATVSAMAASLAAEKLARRRSTPFDFAQADMDGVDGIDWNDTSHKQNIKIKPIPFTLTGLEPLVSRPVSRENMDLDSPVKSRFDSERKELSQSESTGWNDPSSAWMERRANPWLGGGSPSVPGGAPRGLLARQLRGLSVERDEEQADEISR